jgi:MerR family redox-sensitive transcriptional activator SoxR
VEPVGRRHVEVAERGFVHGCVQRSQRVLDQVGLTPDEIRRTPAGLPDERTPTRADWAHLSDSWRPVLDHRIATLVRLREALDSCIGCDCLSLTSCGLYNPGDAAASLGQGARYLVSDDRPG